MVDQNVWAANLVSQVGGALSGLSNKVDSAVRGLSWKQAARAATTASITRSAPGATIDGVTLANGDRILLKNQGVPSENGIYVWSGASAQLARAADADDGAELSGAAVTVTSGAVNGGTVWVQTTPAPIVGSSSITWAQVGAGSGAATSTYTVAPD